MANERIGIEIEVAGYEEAMRKMREVERATSSFRGKNAVINIGGNWDTVSNHIRNLTREMKALDAEKKRLESMGAKGRGSLIGPLNADDQALENITRRLRTVNTELNMLRTASQNTGRTLRQTFNGVSAQIAHFGGSLQSVGNALTRIAAPFQMLTSGALLGLGFNAVGKITSGLSSGFSRYDTMHKYPLMMAEYETANYSAEQSIKDLEESVLGLPTGLDEIVEMAQRYTLSLGDMERGTQLAIATNNAFLASMASEAQQYQGMLQLQDLMNGKDLTSKEWMSLGTSMGKAINEIGKELGYSADQMGVFRQELYSGNIATEDFLNALIKVGTGEGRLAELAALSKTTWDAIGRNVGNRFSKMSERILEAFDEMAMRVTGKTLVQYLAEDALPIINRITDSIVKWIGDNQDKILGFFRDLKQLDIKGFAQGFVQGLGDIFKMAQKLAKFLNDKNLGWLGRFIAKAGFRGSWLTIFGGFIKGARFPIAALVTLVRALGETRGLDMGGGLLGRLLGVGKGGVGNVTGTVSSFSGLFNALKGVLTVAGSVTAISGAGFVAFKAAKSIIKDIGEIIEIAHGIDFGEASVVVAGVVAFIGGFMELGYVMGRNLKGGLYVLAGSGMIGAITTVISGFAALDSWLLKKAVSNVRDVVSIMIETFKLMREVPPAAGSLGNIKSAINKMVELYDVLKFNDTGEGLWSIPAKEANGLRKRITAVRDVIEALKDSLTLMGELTEAPDIESAKQNIIELINGISEIYQVVEQEFELIRKKEVKKEADIMGFMASIVQSIDMMYDTLRNREWTKDMDSRIEGIKKMFTKFTELYDQLNVDFGGRNGSKSSERLASSIASIEQIVTAIDHMYTILREREWTKDMGSRFGGIDAESGKKTGIIGMFDYMKELYDLLAGDYGSKFRNDQSALVNTSLQNLSAVITSIDSIYAVLRGREWNVEMGDRVKNIKRMLVQLGSLDMFLKPINDMDIPNASKSIDNLTAVITSLTSLTTASEGFKGVDLSATVSALKELIPQVEEIGKAFTDGFLENLDFDKMEKAIKNGLDKVLKAANGYDSKFRQKASTIANSFTNTLQAKLSNVSVNTTVTVHITAAIVEGISTIGGAVQNAVNEFKTAHPDLFNLSAGGTIYRAGGGSIFKPRGTDTVPAMLTPGEYVHNRKAVALFGKEFMDKVNSLDINGAMNALHSRFGNQINASRATTINNITNNNNNQQMTQNVYTNNPAFAKLRSNRYVGAL